MASQGGGAFGLKQKGSEFGLGLEGLGLEFCKKDNPNKKQT